MDCQTESEFTEPRIDKVLTQYRESPKMLSFARAIIGQVHDAYSVHCDMLERFNIANCTGEQLTIVAKRIGLQRCHCVCEAVPVFGWECTPSTVNQPVVGFCEDGVWAGCQEAGTSDVCINDDEMFRGYVYARAIQLLRFYDIGSLTTAARQIWGQTASVVDMEAGRVCVSPGRALTTTEQILMPVAFRVLPVAPGIEPYVHRGTEPIFGFGAGWAGFCDGTWLCPEKIDPYGCN